MSTYSALLRTPRSPFGFAGSSLSVDCSLIDIGSVRKHYMPCATEGTDYDCRTRGHSTQAECTIQAFSFVAIQEGGGELIFQCSKYPPHEEICMKKHLRIDGKWKKPEKGTMTESDRGEEMALREI